MNHKTFNFAAVSVLVVSSVFLGAVVFWPDSPKSVNAGTAVQSAANPSAPAQPVSPAQPAALAQNDNSGDFEQLHEAVSYPSEYMAMDTANEFPVIEISSPDSGSSSNYASQTLAGDSSSSFSFDVSTLSSTLSSSGNTSSSSSSEASSSSGGSSGSSGGASSGGSSSGGSSEGDTTQPGDNTTNTQPDTPAITPDSSGNSNPGGGGVRKEHSVVVLPPYQRVLQNNYSISGASSAQIFCAKNETESFQLMICNASVESLPDIEITVSRWDPDRNVSSSPQITLYREHYVKVERSSYNLNSQIGMYPDALIPFINPYTNNPIVNATYLANHYTVSPKTSQGYWADVKVGSNVPAGTYTCSILVTSANAPIAEIPVTLTVWDFTLPSRPAWMAWFCNLRGDIHIPYGVPTGTYAYMELWDRHEMFLYEHGIYPTLRNEPAINESTGQVTFTAEYVAALRAFIDKYGAGVMYIRPRFSDAPAKLAQYIAAYEAFSKANSWAGQFFFYIDEPKSEADYQKVRQCGQIIDQHGPSIKLLVTQNAITPAWWPNVDEAVDINVLISSLATENRAKSVSNRSKEAWVYFALTRSGMNWQVDSDLMDYRIPAWSSYALGINGILYWHTTLWAQPSANSPAFDPWQTQQSFQQLAYDNSGRTVYYNGEGSMIYPGAQADVRGPVASMRLKMFRDSMEDYAYFKLLESKIGRTQAASQVSGVAADFLNYDTSPQSYTTLRKTIADVIAR